MVFKMFNQFFIILIDNAYGGSGGRIYISHKLEKLDTIFSYFNFNVFGGASIYQNTSLCRDGGNGILTLKSNIEKKIIVYGRKKENENTNSQPTILENEKLEDYPLDVYKNKYFSFFFTKDSKRIHFN